MQESSSSAFERALSHLERNDVPATRRSLEAIVAETPDSVEARLALAVLLSNGDERATARKHFVTAFELLADDDRPLAESMRAQTLVNLCALALEDGDWKETRLRENDFDVLRDALMQQGSLEQATQLLLEAGVKAAHENAHDDARILTERAVALDPTFAAAWMNLAALAYRAGAFTDAKNYARRAIEHDESLAEPYALLGNLMIAESSDDGIALLEHALALKPDRIEWMLALATALARQGNYERARSVYARIISIDESRADAHLGFAVASRALGDIHSARFALKRAFELNPSFADAVRRMMQTANAVPADET
jgi:Tfp pilus assembly protein PilF